MVSAQQAFFNLPVRDLNRSKNLFSEIGFAFYPEFTSELAACMVIRENTFVMLVTAACRRTIGIQQQLSTKKE